MWMHYTHDGNTLIHGVLNGGVRLLDVKTGEVKGEHAGPFQPCDFASKSDRLLALEMPSDPERRPSAVTMIGWDIVVYEVAADRLKRVASVSSIGGRPELSPDGQKAIEVTAWRMPVHLRVIEVGSNTVVWRNKLDQYIFDLAYSADGSRLATLSHPGRVDIFDAATGVHQQTITQQTSVDAQNVFRHVAFRPNSNSLLTVEAFGVATVWDLATGRPTAVHDRHRWWAAQFAALGVAFALWIAVWVWWGRKGRRSWQPLFDVLLLHAVILGIAYLRLDRGGFTPEFTRLSAACFQACAASLISLLILWLVYGEPRWPLRLAGSIAGFAVFWGAMLSCWAAYDGLDSEIFGAAIYLFGWQIGWGKGMHLRGTRLVYESGEGSDLIGGVHQRQFTVQDVMVWFSAAALLLAVGRFASPGLMPLKVCALVAVIGCSQAVTAITAVELMRRSAAWWIQLLTLSAVAVAAGAMPRLTFDSFRSYHPAMWWYIGLNSVFAALIVVSLLIIQCHGYRLAKP